MGKNDYSGKANNWSQSFLIKPSAPLPRQINSESNLPSLKPEDVERFPVPKPIRECKGCLGAVRIHAVAVGSYEALKQLPGAKELSLGIVAIPRDTVTTPDFAEVLEDYTESIDALNDLKAVCIDLSGGGMMEHYEDGIKVGMECGATGEVFTTRIPKQELPVTIALNNLFNKE